VGTRATQTGSPKGELRGSERVKRPIISDEKRDSTWFGVPPSGGFLRPHKRGTPDIAKIPLISFDLARSLLRPGHGRAVSECGESTHARAHRSPGKTRSKSN